MSRDLPREAGLQATAATAAARHAETYPKATFALASGQAAHPRVYQGAFADRSTAAITRGNSVRGARGTGSVRR